MSDRWYPKCRCLSTFGALLSCKNVHCNCVSSGHHGPSFGFQILCIYDYNIHSVPDWNTLEYCIQEEYEAKINFEALEKLDPAIRAGIDMDVLASITHTDPALLAKYKPRIPQESTSNTPKSIRSPAQCLSRSSSLHRMNFDSIDKKLSQKIQTIKRNSLDGGNLRRVRTLSDVNGTDSNRGSLSSVVTIMSGRKDSGVSNVQLAL